MHSLQHWRLSVPSSSKHPCRSRVSPKKWPVAHFYLHNWQVFCPPGELVSDRTLRLLLCTWLMSNGKSEVFRPPTSLITDSSNIQMKDFCQTYLLTFCPQLSKKSYKCSTPNRPTWESCHPRGLHPCLTTQNAVSFLCGCKVACLWLQSLLWLLHQPLSGHMCHFFHLPEALSPLSKGLPFEVSITDTITFVSFLSPLCWQGFSSPLTPLVTSAAPTIQPVLNRNALDITSVCLLSTQSAHTAIFWFVGKGARESKLAPNSLNDSALPN